MRTVICLALLLTVTPLVAKDEVYRWVDADGVIHYGSKPPNKDAKPVELPPIQTYKSGSRAPVPAGPVGSPTIVAKDAVDPASIRLRITAPVADETFRDPQGVIAVSVAVTPAQPPESGFQFLLDGVAQNKKPWAAPNYTFTEVERGEHSVQVALIDKDGQTIGRTEKVRIFQMPPTVPRAPPKKGG